VIVRSCWFESSTGHSGPGNAVAGAFFLENFGVDCTQWGLLKPIRSLLKSIRGLLEPFRDLLKPFWFKQMDDREE
jgi:hypothetical protein